LKLNGLSTHQVHQAARFYAAAEATIRGHRAELVGARTRLKVNENIAQVFSRRKAWQPTGDNPIIDDANMVIFVDFATEIPEFYIAPAAWTREEITRRYENWLASVGGTRPRNPASTHRTIDVAHLVQWRDRWDLF
jgi:hypothetical protein